MASFPQFFGTVNQWVQAIPLKALNNAYQSAQKIKAIEAQHFQGKMISADSEGGKITYDYYKSALDRELGKINFNLTQLKITKFFELGKNVSKKDEQLGIQLEQEVREKLTFIESVIGKYRQAEEEKLTDLETKSLLLNNNQDDGNENFLGNVENAIKKNAQNRKKFTEEYEQEVIQQLRILREKKQIAQRIFALLIIVPLLVQIITKNFVYAPVLNFFEVNKVKIEKVRITEELREEALEEYRKYRDLLEINQLFNSEPVSELEKQEKMKDKAKELLLEAGYKSQEGLANVLADISALLAFLGIVYFRRRQCRIALNYFSENFLGFNVVTQVFIFILLTDIFVGFHSAEGWDVILSKTFEHLGLPENPGFNGLFIATIPVILDSIFKLLIFTYFTRKSPTAAAILEKMNQ